MKNLDETMDGFDSSERHPLELLADEFSAALREGSNPSIADFAARVPELHDQAVAMLQSIKMFEQVSSRKVRVIDWNDAAIGLPCTARDAWRFSNCPRDWSRRNGNHL